MHTSRSTWTLLLALGTAAMLVGCGNGGVSPSANPGGTTIVFPPSRAMTMAPTITIRGVVPDSSNVVGVTVNGVSAVSTDGFATWSAQIPLAEGDNDVEVSVDRGAGFAKEADGWVRREGPLLATFTVDAALDPTAGVLYQLDREGSLFALDLATGRTRLVTSALRDSHEGRIAVDATTGLVYVSDRPSGLPHRVTVVDSATGSTTILTETGDGNGPDITGNLANSVAAPIAIDPVAGLVLVLDDLRTGTFENRVFGVGITTGTRTVLGGMPRDDASAFVDLAAAPGTGAAILFDREGSTIWSFDLGTGAFTARGTGVPMGLASRFSVDVTGDIAYRINSNDVTAIDQATGTETVVSPDPGSDAELRPHSHVLFNQADGLLYALADGASVLVRIDPVTGTRSLVHRLTSTGKEVDADDLVVTDDGRIVFCDSSDHTIRSLGLPDGQRDVVSSDTVGAGPAFDEPQGIGLAPGQGAVYVANSSLSPNGVYCVDLATGLRQVVTGAGVGTGIDICYSIDMDCSADGTLYVVDEDDDQVVAVDPATGDRRRVAGDGVGTGPEISSEAGCDYDDATGNLYLCESDTILAIDPTTGDRTVLVDGTSFSPPRTFSPADVVASGDGAQLYVLDRSDGTLHRIDVATATPTLVYDPSTTTGYPLRRPDRAFGRLAHGVLFVTDNHYDARWAFDVETGECVILDR